MPPQGLFGTHDPVSSEWSSSSSHHINALQPIHIIPDFSDFYTTLYIFQRHLKLSSVIQVASLLNQHDSEGAL